MLQGYFFINGAEEKNNDHMYKFYRVGTICSTWVFHVPYLPDFRISFRIFQEFPFIKSLSGDRRVCLSAYVSALQNFYFIDLVNSLENYDTSQSCLIYDLYQVNWIVNVKVSVSISFISSWSSLDSEWYVKWCEGMSKAHASRSEGPKHVTVHN